MTKNQIDCILAVAEVGSMSKVAEIFYISQSSLSQLIKRVETEYGVQIFKRVSGKKLELTYAGEVFVKSLKEMKMQEDILRQRMDEIKDCKRGKLSIGIANGCNVDMLTDVLPKFISDFPDVKIYPFRAKTQVIEEMVLNRQLDIAIIFNQDMNAKLEYIPFLPGELTVLCPISFAEKYNVKGLQISIRDLLNEPFLQLKKGSRIREWTDMVFINLNRAPEKVLETNDISIICSMVAAGMGYSIVPSGYVHSTSSSNNCLRLRMSDVPVRWPLSIVHRKDMYLSGYIREMISLLLQWASEEIGKGHIV